MGSGRKRPPPPPPPPVVEEEGHDSDGGSMKKRKFLPTSIRNKEKGAAVHAELKREKVEKKKRAKLRYAAEKKALELGEAPPPRKVPRTIENTREADETVCMPDDEELFAGNDADEFNSILKKERTPKVLITTCRFNSTIHGNPTDNKPELVMNNFTTRLGHRIGRLMQSLFRWDPDFRGRRVVAFHNQPDFIFFRHHRYIFEDKEIKKVYSADKTAKGAKSKNLPQQ